jgi:hypothetical protein
LHTGDSHHHGAENHRRNQHLDEFYEPVAERFHGGAGLRIEVTQQHAQSDGHQHLKVQ